VPSGYRDQRGTALPPPPRPHPAHRRRTVENAAKQRDGCPRYKITATCYALFAIRRNALVLPLPPPNPRYSLGCSIARVPRGKAARMIFIFILAARETRGGTPRPLTSGVLVSTGSRGQQNDTSGNVVNGTASLFTFSFLDFFLAFQMGKSIDARVDSSVVHFDRGDPSSRDERAKRDFAETPK